MRTHFVHLVAAIFLSVHLLSDLLVSGGATIEKHLVVGIELHTLDRRISCCCCGGSSGSVHEHGGSSGCVSRESARGGKPPSTGQLSQRISQAPL